VAGNIISHLLWIEAYMTFDILVVPMRLLSSTMRLTTFRRNLLPPCSR